MLTEEVFGISPQVREASYVDRGDLDSKLKRSMRRTKHVALRGPSKSGKSWLRQRVVEDSIVIQCRLNKSFVDIYVDALSQLDINLTITSTKSGELKGSIKANGSFGSALLGKIGLSAEASGKKSEGSEEKPVGKDIDDLRYIADILKASGKRLVIEDFHYMSTDDRKKFAFDLKALWDYEYYVIIVGVWSETNLLLHLNTDLAGRVDEISIAWTPHDLKRIIEKGSKKLNLEVQDNVKNKLVELAYTNAGVLQNLMLLTLDEAGIERKRIKEQHLRDINFVDAAAMEYAEQLNPVYQQFSKQVSGGIRARPNSTGIYAYAMATIMDASDDTLIRGYHAKDIFEAAHKKQERIQLGNLKTILEKIPNLQVDDAGRGLIITYNSATEEVSVVDRQLLLYRRFATVRWPWEDMIEESERTGDGLDGEK